MQNDSSFSFEKEAIYPNVSGNEEKKHTIPQREKVMLDDFVAESDLSLAAGHLPPALRLLAVGALLLESAFINFNEIRVQTHIGSMTLTYVTNEGMRAYLGAGGVLTEMFIVMVGLASLRAMLRADILDAKERRDDRRVAWACALVPLLIVGPLATCITTYAYSQVMSMKQNNAFYKSLIWTVHSVIFTSSLIFFGIGINALYTLYFEKGKGDSKARDSFKALCAISLGATSAVLLPLLKEKLLGRLVDRNYSLLATNIVSAYLTSLTIFLGISCLTLRLLYPVVKGVYQKHVLDKLSTSTYVSFEGGDRNRKVAIGSRIKSQKSAVLTCLMTGILMTSTIIVAGLSSVLDLGEILSGSIFKTLAYQTLVASSIILAMLTSFTLYRLAGQLVDSKCLVHANRNDGTSRLVMKDLGRKKNAGTGLIVIAFCVAVLVTSYLYTCIQERYRYFTDVESLRPQVFVPLILIISMLVIVGIVLHGKSAFLEKQAAILSSSEMNGSEISFYEQGQGPGELVLAARAYHVDGEENCKQKEI